MRRAFCLVIAIAAGCGGPARTPASPDGPTSPPEPAAAEPPIVQVEPSPPGEPTGCPHADPSTPVQVGFTSEFTAKDVATWYIGVTCKTVVIPRSALSRVSSKPVTERIQRTQVDDMFVTLLAELQLAHIADGALVVIVDRATTEVAGRPNTRARLIISPAVNTNSRRSRVPSVGEFKDGVLKIDDTHYEVRRSTWRDIWDKPAAMARGARIVPSVKNGQPNGFKVYAVRPSSMWASVGFRNGDTVHSVNGAPITTPDRALEVATRLKDADRVAFDITRRGRSIVLRIDIVDDE